MIAWQPGMSLESLERLAILEAMKFFHNNKAATARALGIAPRTLDAKLEKYASETKEQEKYDEQQRRSREDFLRRQRNGALASTSGVVSGSSEPTVTSRPQGESTTSNGAATGVDAQSVAPTPSQPSVPVPQRKEVQSVLPKETSKTGAGGRR